MNEMQHNWIRERATKLEKIADIQARRTDYMTGVRESVERMALRLRKPGVALNRPARQNRVHRFC